LETVDTETFKSLASCLSVVIKKEYVQK